MGNNKSKIHTEKKFILGIINPQNDFFKGGSLEVPNAEDIIGPINKLRFLCYDYMNTFISQDYHPPNHMSFASTYNEKPFTNKKLSIVIKNDKLEINQTLWPNHCVQNTDGSNFHKDLIVIDEDQVVRKGANKNVESYSAFGDDNHGKYEDTGLYDFLKSKGITDIVIVGVATDYCVYNTVLDTYFYGFNVHLILSCIRGVAVDTTTKAINHMKELRNVTFYDNVEEFYKVNKTQFIKLF